MNTDINHKIQLLEERIKQLEVHSIEAYLGEIRLFAGNFAPSGWALCQGQQLAINQYEALYALLGTTFGGDGHTNFKLPDLRGRSVIQHGQGPGLTPLNFGEIGGIENMTLDSRHLPVHNHKATLSPIDINMTLYAYSEGGDSNSPEGRLLANSVGTDKDFRADGTKVAMQAGAVSGFASATVTTETSGSSESFNIRPPYLALNYIICLEGIFPARP